MSHAALILFIVAAALVLTLASLIKNRPQYLVLLGIRGLFSFFFFRILNKICLAAGLPSMIAANPISLAVGSLLGFPGILLLYLSKLYFL